MKMFNKVLLFILALSLIHSHAHAFILYQEEVSIGEPVYIGDANEEMYYAVFLPFEEPTNGQVCASMTGEEILEDNNLRNYGTCFINDEGTFTVVELSEPFSSSYEDLLENDEIIQEESIILLPPEENKGILSILGLELEKETSGSTETSSSEGSVLGKYVLGPKTKSFLITVRDNYLPGMLILLTLFTLVLGWLILNKEDKKPKKKKKSH